MNLVKVNPTPAFTVKCIRCGKQDSSDAQEFYADTEGQPFKAYYCATCRLMLLKRTEVAPELLPAGADPVEEAKLHPGMVEGFTHWSSPGWDKEKNCPVTVLTFDPSCPRCKELKGDRT